jgi:hypothetical protein
VPFDLGGDSTDPLPLLVVDIEGHP